MHKILIFGNSGSGKSTFAKELVEAEQMPHLDLDSLAWLPTEPPVRAPLEHSELKIKEFMAASENWVIEGCYTDLLELASPEASEIIFMNLDVSLCIENAKNRPWEPHKYKTKKAQDRNLDMLIEWIEQYNEREDVFSLKSHLRFYDNFPGKKTMVLNNERLT